MADIQASAEPREGPKQNNVAPAESLPAPTEQAEHCLLDEFIFHKMLAEGGFGKVFLATHKESGKLVAIKAIKKTLAMRSLISLRREKEVLMMVADNRFCSRLFITFQTWDYLFFVMEFLCGGDLWNLLDNKGPCNVDCIKFLAAELICALESLHNKGILHR